VIVVYGMISSPDGTFHSWRYRLWMTFWLSAAILGPMVWIESARTRDFVHDYEKWIAWLSVIAMLVFVARGQWVILKTLFHHFMQGNYTVKRFQPADRALPRLCITGRPLLVRPDHRGWRSSALIRSSCRGSPAHWVRPLSSRITARIDLGHRGAPPQEGREPSGSGVSVHLLLELMAVTLCLNTGRARPVA